MLVQDLHEGWNYARAQKSKGIGPPEDSPMEQPSSVGEVVSDNQKPIHHQCAILHFLAPAHS
jgi:hypothetical protein